MTPLPVLFAGTPDVAVPAFDLLVDDPRFEIVAVLTNPDRPRGRSSRPEPSPIALRARERGIALLQPERPLDSREDIVASGAQVGAVVAYGAILPEAVLRALPLGFVNLHFSLLPRWRGAAPVQHAIRAGDPRTGITVFQLDPGMDTGPILRSLERPVPDGIDAGELLDVLASEGAPLLAEGLLALAAGELPRPQDPDGVTLAPKLRQSDAEVEWTVGAEQVARLIRSVTPRPGAHTLVGAERVKLAGVTVVPDAAPLPPGTVVASDDALVVACGQGAVRIERVQFPGRPWSSAADQLRGRRFASGVVLGRTG